MRDNRVVFRGSDGEMHAGYAVEENNFGHTRVIEGYYNQDTRMDNLPELGVDEIHWHGMTYKIRDSSYIFNSGYVDGDWVFDGTTKFTIVF